MSGSCDAMDTHPLGKVQRARVEPQPQGKVGVPARGSAQGCHAACRVHGWSSTLR
jgi:hypothetical protein